MIRVITKLPNTEQSSKGKVKTHNSINRQNQSTTGKLGNLDVQVHALQELLIASTKCIEFASIFLPTQIGLTMTTLYKYIIVKAAFATVPTDQICVRNLSSTIPVDMNSIFMKLYLT